MKILIDIDRELAEGHMTLADHARLKALARQGIADLALNSLIGFGIVAFTLGFAFISGSIPGLMMEGAVMGLTGVAIVFANEARTRVLGRLLVVVGLILFGGAGVVFDAFSARSILAAAALLFGAAMVIESGLLMALSVVTLSCAMGASAAYQHAEYTLFIDHPTETIGTFTLLAIAGIAAAGWLPRREGVLLIGSRTAALLVNFAFLVGSLGGDTIGETKIPAAWFSIGWALALLAAAVWAWHANRRWPLVTATVFAAIHFYTQLFEGFGANAAALLAAGLATIVIGFALKFLLARIGARFDGSAEVTHGT